MEKYRQTKQRKLIYQVLLADKSHPSAEEIYKKVKKLKPDKSYATVYRNLKTLKAQGKIKELKFEGEDFSRFDANTKPHYHFRCIKCGRIYDIEVPPLKDCEKLVAQLSGHDIHFHEIFYFGICKICKESFKKQV